MSQQFYDIISMVIMALGGAMLLIAIAGDPLRQRAKKKRICPKCWYDLSHTKGLTCSECGYTAKHEGKLYKSRRRWRLVWFALLFFTVSHGVRVAPAVKDQGWIAALPTIALIAALPFLEPDLDVVVGAKQPNNIFDSILPPKPNWRDTLYLDLLERCAKSNSLWKWQIGLLRLISNLSIEGPEIGEWQWDELWMQVAAGTKWCDESKLNWYDFTNFDDCGIVVKTRPIWPIGSKIYADFDSASYNTQYQLKGYGVSDELIGFQREEILLSRYSFSPPSLWGDGHDFIGLISNEQTDLQYSFSRWERETSFQLFLSRWGISCQVDTQLPMRVEGKVEEILTPVHSDSFENKLARNMQPEVNIVLYTNLLNKEPALDLGITPDKLKEALNLIPSTTFAYRAEILCRDKLVASGEAWHMLTIEFHSLAARPYLRKIKLNIIDEDTLTNPNNDQPFTLRLVGDPYVALRNFDCDWYWEGEVTVPLNVKLK